MERKKNPNPSPNPNLNQQPGEIAKKNVFQRNVKGKRTGGNVQKGLQTNAKKPVGRRKNQKRKNQKEGGKYSK